MKSKVIIAIAVGIVIAFIVGITIENQTANKPTNNLVQNSSQSQPIGKQLFLNLTDSVGMKTK
ncbi:MAG: hypothetical protein ACREA7_02505 [Nitrosotalea sp.]